MWDYHYSNFVKKKKKTVFIYSIQLVVHDSLVAEYENLRKAILENNVNITKRIINDLNIDKEIVVNFAPKEDNSLLFM